MQLTHVLQAAIIAACALAAMAGNPAVRLLLRRINPGGGGQLQQGTLFDAQRELPGGRWIGILERAAAYVCMMTAFPAGIAMILAVKGLGRYPELRTGENPRIGELFIIGTFASLLWAAAWAGVAILGTRAVAAS